MQLVKRFVSSYLYDDSAFRYVYILSLFFSSVCFIELSCQIATGVFMVWSMFIMHDKFSKKRIHKSIDYCWILIMFFLSGLFTSLIHVIDNFHINILMMYHVSICFFIFYGSYIEPDKKKIKFEMQRVFKTIVISTTVLSILGLILSISFITIECCGYYVGLRDNRYTGLFTNPNLSAFSSVIALVFCHYLMEKKDCKDPEKKVLPKWISISCIVSNILALLLSDSNASMLFIIVYCITLAFYNLYLKNRAKRLIKIVSYSIGLLLICVLAIIGIFFIRSVCQDMVANIINSRYSSEILNGEANNNSILDTADIGRDGDYEISSGRIDSLKKAIVLYSKNPLFGIGKGNIVEYGDRYLSEGFNFTDLHNGYLTILLSTGAVGFILFMIFALLVAVNIINKLIKFHDEKNLPILFSMIVAYSVFSLFERALLFDITFMVVIFWMILGYTMSVALSASTMKRNFETKSTKMAIINIKQKKS